MRPIKLHDLESFNAVVAEGSFQAAGLAMKRTHPSVFAAVARLEEALGLRLLDRTGYRVALTDAGRLFHARAQSTLGELDHLLSYAEQLASGEETALRIVIGDLTPLPPHLHLLGRFFTEHARTRLHLSYEAVGGPLERLLDGEADLVIHRADPADARLERIELQDVTLVPVVAPGFLPFAPSRALTPERMRPFTQCVVRDTAQRTASESYFLVEGAHQCSAPDQLMKKELIIHGLAWGHLPGWLIESELRDGTLLSIAAPHLPGRTERLAALRRRRPSHGPVAEALWRYIAERPARKAPRATSQRTLARPAKKR